MGSKYRETARETVPRPNFKFIGSWIKAVVGGTAGPAMAVPLFWPKMVLAVPLFWPIMIFFFLLGHFFSADHDDQRLSNNIDN